MRTALPAREQDRLVYFHSRLNMLCQTHPRPGLEQTMINEFTILFSQLPPEHKKEMAQSLLSGTQYVGNPLETALQTGNHFAIEGLAKVINQLNLELDDEFRSFTADYTNYIFSYFTQPNNEGFLNQFLFNIQNFEESKKLFEEFLKNLYEQNQELSAETVSVLTYYGISHEQMNEKRREEDRAKRRGPRTRGPQNPKQGTTPGATTIQLAFGPYKANREYVSEFMAPAFVPYSTAENENRAICSAEISSFIDYLNDHHNISTNFNYFRSNQFFNIGYDDFSRLSEFWTYFHESDQDQPQTLVEFSTEKNKIIDDLLYFISHGDKEIPLWLSKRIAEVGGIEAIEQYVYNPHFKRFFTDQIRFISAKLPQEITLQDLIDKGASKYEIDNFIKNSDASLQKIKSLTGLIAHPEAAAISQLLDPILKAQSGDKIIQNLFVEAVRMGAFDFLKCNSNWKKKWAEPKYLDGLTKNLTAQSELMSRQDEEFAINLLRAGEALNLDLNVSNPKIFQTYLYSALIFAYKIEKDTFEKKSKVSLNYAAKVADSAELFESTLCYAARSLSDLHPNLLIPLLKQIKTAKLYSAAIQENIFSLFDDEESPLYDLNIFHTTSDLFAAQKEEEDFFELLRWVKSEGDVAIGFLLEPQHTVRPMTSSQVAKNFPASFKKFYTDFILPLPKNFQAAIFKMINSGDDIEREPYAVAQLFTHNNFLIDAITAAFANIDGATAADKEEVTRENFAFLKEVFVHVEKTIGAAEFHTLLSYPKEAGGQTAQEMILARTTGHDKEDFEKLLEETKQKFQLHQQYEGDLEFIADRYSPLLMQNYLEGKHIKFDNTGSSEMQIAYNRDYFINKTTPFSRLINYLNGQVDLPFHSADAAILTSSQVREISWQYLHYNAQQIGGNIFPRFSYEKSKRDGVVSIEEYLAVELISFAIKKLPIPLWLQEKVRDVSDAKDFNAGIERVSANVKNPQIQAIFNNTRQDKEAPRLVCAKKHKNSDLQMLLEAGASAKDIKAFLEKRKEPSDLRPTDEIILHPEFPEILHELTVRYSKNPTFPIVLTTYYAKAILNGDQEFLEKNHDELNALLDKYLVGANLSDLPNILTPTTILGAAAIKSNPSFARDMVILPFYSKLQKLDGFSLAKPQDLLEHLQTFMSIYPDEFGEYLKKAQKFIPDANFKVMLMWNLNSETVSLIDSVRIGCNEENLRVVREIYEQSFVTSSALLKEKIAARFEGREVRAVAPAVPAAAAEAMPAPLPNAVVAAIEATQTQTQSSQGQAAASGN